MTRLQHIEEQERLHKNKRQAGKAIKENENKALLEKVISVFFDFLDRPFVPSDYNKFKRNLFKTFPTPAHIRTPRLTKEEKMLSPERRAEELELKKRTGWSDPTLRKFFFDRTGVKASTKKVL